VTIEQLVAEGDFVVARIRMVGTHQGEWQGIATTGKRVENWGIIMRRVQDGKLVEGWVEPKQDMVKRELGTA
jgi:predicted ester cyclase